MKKWHWFQFILNGVGLLFFGIMIYVTYIAFSRSPGSLVLRQVSNEGMSGAKAPGLNDRKWVSINSIQTHLRSFNRGSFRASSCPHLKLDGALGLDMTKMQQKRTALNQDRASPAIPAKKLRMAERGLSAGSVCDEFVAIATDEEQNEPDGGPQPASLSFLAGIAGAAS